MAGPFKLDNQYANYAGYWLANTAYTQGKRVIAESTNAGDARKYVFECTTAGTSADPGPPTWVITPGNTTSDGTVTWTCREATTWANAHGKIDWIALRAAAGEIIHIDDSHNDSVKPSCTFNGTEGAPVKVITVDKATDNAVATYNTGTQLVGCGGVSGEAYFWGTALQFSTDDRLASTGTVVYEKCNIKLAYGGGRLLIQNDNATAVFINTDVDLSQHTTNNIRLRYPSTLIWRGGELSGDVNFLFDIYEEAPYIEIIGADLSSMVGGTIISLGETDERLQAYLKGIKLNASPPDLITAGVSPERGSHILMDIADSGSTVYKFRREYQYGYAQDETIKVITGKALYDGTNEFTTKMMSRATPIPTFFDPWRYHLTTLRETGFAASRTYTVHIAQDHASVQPAALEDDEIWLEVVYPDDTTSQYNIKTDKIATPTTTPAAQTTSTETWEGLAATTRLQELSVQIDAADGKNGPVEIWVCLAKEDKTIYVCPEVYVS